MALSVAILLIVPMIMLYIALHDEFEKGAIRKFRESGKRHRTS